MKYIIHNQAPNFKNLAFSEPGLDYNLQTISLNLETVSLIRELCQISVKTQTESVSIYLMTFCKRFREMICKSQSNSIQPIIQIPYHSNEICLNTKKRESLKDIS